MENMQTLNTEKQHSQFAVLARNRKRPRRYLYGGSYVSRMNSHIFITGRHGCLVGQFQLPCGQRDGENLFIDTPDFIEQLAL